MMWRSLFLSVLAFCSVSFAEPPQPARFEPHLAGIRKIFREKDPEKIVDALINGGRTHFFSIEGLARIYEEGYPETMESLKDQSKAMEDLVGRSVDMRLHIEYAEKVGAPREVIALLKRKMKAQRQVLLDFLREEEWIESENPRLERWERKIEKTDWDGPKKDRRYILEQLFEKTQELRHDEWEITNLQEGLHDFRRRLRWLSIYNRGLADLIVLDDRPMERWDGILSDPIAQGEFAKLPERTKLGFPILIPLPLHLEIASTIEELGNAKDTGEAQHEWLREALLESGIAKTNSEASRMAVEYSKKHPNYRDVLPTARKFFNRIRANDHRYNDKENRGILVALKERLKEQMDWDKEDCHRAMASMGAN